MFERLERGWDMAIDSCRVLQKDKELLLFPLLSGLSSLLVLASFVWPLWATGYAQRVSEQPEPWREPVSWAILFAYYFVNYFLIVFFNSALVACALIRFRGGDPTVADGFRAACSRLPQIAAWALVSATVGFALKAAERRSKRGGQIVAAILGVVWSVATFFVVPVLVIENLGPLAALKRSTKIIQDQWGESFVADLGIGLVSFLAAIPGFALGWLGTMALSRGQYPLGAALVGMAVIELIVVSLVSSTLEIIARTGLYMEAVDDKVIRKFERQMGVEG